MTQLTSNLSRGLVRLLSRPVDSKTRSRATWHVLDWLACAAVGSAEPVGRLLADWTARAPDGNFLTIGGPAVAVPELAVRCNGGLGNAVEMDDVHKKAILHPGPVVVPAALTTAQETGATARSFLEAVVRGYEAMIRLGNSVGPGHYANWHNTSTCGPFGAAAAAGSLLNLNEEQSIWALGSAATQASGPWRCRHEQVMTKQLHTARSAESGYLAASLALRGFTGPENILEGEQGFFQAMCPDALPDQVLASRDGPWKIWETSFKPWPACRHAHAAIDAALEIRNRLDGQTDRVSQVLVRTYRDALRFCDHQNPETTEDARFSLQHCVAVALLNGEPRFEHFVVETTTAPKVAELRNRTSAIVDTRFDSRYPTHFGSGIEVTLVDGSKLAADVVDALGDPERPLTEKQITVKATRLMTAARVPESVVSQVIEASLGLADTGELARPIAVLRILSHHLKQNRAN